MNPVYDKLCRCYESIKNEIPFQPQVALVLGSGLGDYADQMRVVKTIAYRDIEGFPVSTAPGHVGQFVFGYVDDAPVVAMQGRVHYYEGYDMKTVTYPIRVMHELGIRTLFVSNAAGGMNPDFAVGDIMFIRDHINLFPEHPLRGKNFPTGPRFPDMSEAYDRELLRKAHAIAESHGIKVHEGVYVGVSGPTYETPAEYRFYHLTGGDAVGMSTVPEVIVARHSNIRVFGVSIITDLGVEGSIVKVSHEEVQQAANAAQPLLAAIMRDLIAE